MQGDRHPLFGKIAKSKANGARQGVGEKPSHLENLRYIAEDITNEEDGGSSAG